MAPSMETCGRHLGAILEICWISFVIFWGYQIRPNLEHVSEAIVMHFGGSLGTSNLNKMDGIRIFGTLRCDMPSGCILDQFYKDFENRNSQDGVQES